MTGIRYLCFYTTACHCFISFFYHKLEKLSNVFLNLLCLTKGTVHACLSGIQESFTQGNSTLHSVKFQSTAEDEQQHSTSRLCEQGCFLSKVAGVFWQLGEVYFTQLFFIQPSQPCFLIYPNAFFLVILLPLFPNVSYQFLTPNVFFCMKQKYQRLKYICYLFSLYKTPLFMLALWQFFFYPFLIGFLQIKVTTVLFTQL